MTPSGQPRLCFVTHKVQRNDGQGRVNYEIVLAALQAGFHVTLLASECAAEIVDHQNAQFVHVRVKGYPSELLRNLVFANVTARYLRQHRARFDLVQANGFVTWERADVVAAHFVHTAWLRSADYPFRSLRPYSLYQRLYTTLNTRWERSAFLRARRVVAVSANIADDLIALGVHRDVISVIFNGVDLEQFQPGPSQRALFGLPAEDTLALFVGDIRTPRKNLGTLLRALRDVREIRLVVAGALAGSPYPEEAKRLGVADRVLFLGKVSGMEDLMRSVDFFVFPSRYEAHPLVLLEAMASGLASIVPDRFGAPALIGRAGLVMGDPDNASRLAECMRTLAEDASLRRLMGNAGRERALTMDWSAMAERYLVVYRELLLQQDKRYEGTPARN